MPTIEEKRTIAENLRYEANYPSRPVRYMEQFIEDLRQIIIVDGGHADYSELFSRLADLIEPSCDRDALLELADEMEIDGAGALDDDDWCKPLLVEYAQRIRKALGVDDGD